MTPLDSTIIVALITGGLSLLGVIITVRQGNTRTEQMLAAHQAVQDTKIDHLTEEVKKHNNFASEIPAIKQKIADIEKRIDRIEEHMTDIN